MSLALFAKQGCILTDLTIEYSMDGYSPTEMGFRTVPFEGSIRLTC